MNFARIIKEIERSGLTQAKIADEVGCFQGNISALKAGKTKSPLYPLAMELLSLHNEKCRGLPRTHLCLPDFRMIIGDLEDSGMLQQQIADAVGCSQGNLYFIKKKGTIPNFHLAKRLVELHEKSCGEPESSSTEEFSEPPS